jgi:hypothetical protein
MAVELKLSENSPSFRACSPGSIKYYYSDSLENLTHLRDECTSTIEFIESKLSDLGSREIQNPELINLKQILFFSLALYQKNKQLYNVQISRIKKLTDSRYKCLK